MGMLATSLLFTDLSARAQTMVTDSTPADDASGVTAIADPAASAMGVEETMASGFTVALSGFTVTVSGTETAGLFYSEDSD
jgi:hypothetical protein